MIILSGIVLMVLFFILVALFIRFLPDVSSSKVGTIAMTLVILIGILVLAALITKWIYGKLIPVGTVEFNPSTIEIKGKLNKTITYEKLTHLTMMMERPKSYFWSNSGPRSYTISFTLESGDQFSIITDSGSVQDNKIVDMYQVLFTISRQNHYLYKVLRNLSQARK